MSTPSVVTYNRDRRRFLSFLKRTNQKEVMAEYVANHLKCYASGVSGALRTGQQLVVWDVGAGAGDEYLPLLKRFQEDSAQVYTLVHEPNMGVASRFFFNHLVAGFDFGRLRSRADSMVDVARDEPASKDFVLASHMFYYLEDWEGSLRAIYDSLVPGGVACLALTSEQGNLYQVRKRFFPALKGAPPHSGEQLSHLLTRMKIPHKDELVTSTLRLEERVEEDYKVEFGMDALYSFFLRVDYNGLPEKERKEVDHFVRNRAKKKGWALKDWVVWIQKPGDYRPQPAREEPRDKKITLGDFMKFMGPAIEQTVGAEVDFLPEGVRKAYFKILSLDCVLNHPVTKPLIFRRGNTIVDYERIDHEYAFPPSLDPEEVVVFDSKDPVCNGFLRAFNDPKDDRHTLLQMERFTWRWEFLPYLGDFKNALYDRLPKKERRKVRRDDFERIMMLLYLELEHDQFYSYWNRSTLGSYVRNEYIRQDSIRHPKNPSPLWEEWVAALQVRKKGLLPFPIAV